MELFLDILKILVGLMKVYNQICSLRSFQLKEFTFNSRS